MHHAFDPLAFAEQLEQAGVPQAQAQIHARGIIAARTGAASNQALREVESALRRDLNKVESSLRNEMTLLEQRLEKKIDAAIDALRLELLIKIERLQTEMALHRWVLGGIFSLQVATLVKMYSL